MLKLVIKDNKKKWCYTKKLSDFKKKQDEKEE